MSAPAISFEFFPPRDLAGALRLGDALAVLAPLRPDFVSVTYGAGGTTRALTHEAVTTIGARYGVPVAAHLTCVDASRAETMAIVDAYAEAGVDQIVALRGDPVGGATRFAPHPEGFASSVELIEAIAKRGGFTIRCGAYPEPHPDSPDTAADVAFLKRKVDAGASSAITQFFFDADAFFRFRDACDAAGIAAPIIPGILPVESWKGTRRFAQRCGAHVPADWDGRFAQAEAEGRATELAQDLCVDLCRRLIAGGVDRLHFYTLNKPGLTAGVCAALGIVPDTAQARVA